MGLNRCGKGSTCPRFRWLRFSTPPKKVSCARDLADGKRSRRSARNVDAKVILYADTMTTRCNGRSKSPTGAASCKRPITASTGSHQRPSQEYPCGARGGRAAHAQSNAAVGRTDDAQYITEEYLNELEQEMLAAAEAWVSNGCRASRPDYATTRQVGKRTDEVELRHSTRAERDAPQKGNAGPWDGAEAGAAVSPVLRTGCVAS